MQSPIAREMSFTLEDGYTAAIGQEEGRVYDQIIKSNIGVVATIALEGELVHCCQGCLLELTIAGA